jgi:hypothetical protein
VGWTSLADIDAPSLVLCSDCAHPGPIRRLFIGFPSRPGLGRHSPFLSHTGSQPITVSAFPEEVVIDDFRQSYGCLVFPIYPVDVEPITRSPCNVPHESAMAMSITEVAHLEERVRV